MKFKEIKPGMVIHCPTEEDARVLFEHLAEIGYKMGTEDCDPLTKMDFAKANINYHIDDFQKRFFILCTGSDMPGEVTEFSDLIEPDDTPMTAVEVLSWLKDNRYTGACKEVFSTYSAGYVIDTWSPEEIVKKITAYEAAKKAPKPVEKEIGYMCIIYNEFHLVTEKHELWLVTEQDARTFAQGWLDDYTANHKGLYTVSVEYMARQKESES